MLPHPMFNWAASGQFPVTLLEPKLDMKMYVLVLPTYVIYYLCIRSVCETTMIYMEPHFALRSYFFTK